MSIVQHGDGNGAPGCQTCHGEHGEGNPELGFPGLSGLAQEYVLHQLQSFADGSRANDTMQPVAKALSDNERGVIATYYATLPLQRPKSGEALDTKLVARGKLLAESGDWSKGLPGCGSCHGAFGQGVGASFPPLAGQPTSYLSTQLVAWKGKTRKGDPLELMAGISGRLSDDDVKAVSAYYASLPASDASNGGSR